MVPIRLSIVTETYVPDVNGVANSLRQLIQSLDPQHYRIQIIRTRPRSSWIPDEEEVWCRGLTIPMYPDLQIGLPSRRRVASVWNRFQPDIVYIATEGPLGNSCLKEARRRSLPVISAFHTNFHRYSGYYGFGWIKTLILKWLRHFHNRTLATLVPSQESADLLQQSGFERVHVLPHGVDCDLFHPRRRSIALRQHWGVEDGGLVMLYVGRIAAEKNIPLLIKSYQQARQKMPDLTLVMVGDGPMRAELEEAHPDVHFAGIQTGELLARYYASADLFVFASVTETFGLVTLEAMASGLPVVAYDMAAAGQFVEPGKNGELAQPGNEDEFNRSLMLALQQPLCRLGQSARETAEQASWQSVASQFDAHVEKAMSMTSRSYSSVAGEKVV